jgi:hypothetical protein
MFPAISVTIIGLIVGGISADRRRIGWPPLAGGVVGAWVGFALGTLVGIAVDELFGTGIWVALIGHASAVLIGWIAAERAPVLGQAR